MAGDGQPPADVEPLTPGRSTAPVLLAGILGVLILVSAAATVVVWRSSTTPEVGQAQSIARDTCRELWTVRLYDEGLDVTQRLALLTTAVGAYQRFDVEAARAAALDPRWTAMAEAVHGLRVGIEDQRALLIDGSDTGDAAARAAVSQRTRPFLQTLIDVCTPLRR